MPERRQARVKANKGGAALFPTKKSCVRLPAPFLAESVKQSHARDLLDGVCLEGIAARVKCAVPEVPDAVNAAHLRTEAT